MVLLGAAALVLSVGVFLFVLSGDTERLFAWTIKPPLTAAFLGANYWAAFFLAVLSARERIWANARLTFAVSAVFITLTMFATALQLEKFNFDNVNGWLWAVVYFGIPPLLVVLIVLQLRLPGGDPPRRRPIERWLYPSSWCSLRSRSRSGSRSSSHRRPPTTSGRGR